MEEGHWLVVGGRKEGSSGPLGPPEKGGHRKSAWRGLEPHFLAPWGEAGRGPITKTTRHGLGDLSHQLTMGSTSASRSNSSWISSVLPESLLAMELGDGEFLEGTREWGTSEGSLRTSEEIQRAGKMEQPFLENLASEGDPAPRPALAPLALESSKPRS